MNILLLNVLVMSDDETANTTSTSTSVTAKTSSTPTTYRLPLPQVKPPPPLNLKDCSAKKWKLWKQNWLNFAIVSKLSSQDESYQKALFLCTIGQCALEIFSDKINTILAKFDDYFTGDVNKTYERFKFNQWNQEAGENFDAYLTALNFCTCPAVSDSLLRDRIVLGIKNEDARKRLLQESLTSRNVSIFAELLRALRPIYRRSVEKLRKFTRLKKTMAHHHLIRAGNEATVLNLRLDESSSVSSA